MKSPERLSQMIRAKKKLMQENRDVIDSGGSPSMDLQDEDSMRREEIGDALSENTPKEHSDGEGLSPEAEMTEEEHEQHSNDNPRQDEMSEAELAGIKLKMARGGVVDLADENRDEARHSGHEELLMAEGGDVQAEDEENPTVDGHNSDELSGMSEEEAQRRREAEMPAAQLLAEGGEADEKLMKRRLRLKAMLAK